MKPIQSILIAVITTAIVHTASAQQLRRYTEEPQFTRESQKTQTIALEVDDQYWVDVSSASGGRFDAAYPMKIYNNALYAMVSDPVNQQLAIARYTKADGWSVQCFIELDGDVNKFSVDGDDIYISGNFTEVGPKHIPANNIARYNPVSGWSALGDGLTYNDTPKVSNLIARMEAYKGKVYVGGYYTNSGDKVLRYNYVIWDGKQWQIDDQATRLDYPLIVRKDYLYSSSCGIAPPSCSVVRWNGIEAEYIPPGAAIDLYVDGAQDMTVTENGTCYIASNIISRPSGGQHRGLAVLKLDNNGLALVGDTSEILGEAGSVLLDITADNAGRVFVAGDFGPYKSKAPIIRVAAWDGAQWTPMGSGIGRNDRAFSCIVYDGDVYFGGYFKKAGGKPSNGFAKWTKGVTSVAEGSNPASSAVFPNPAQERMTITPGVTFSGDCTVTLYDSFGRVVRTASVTSGEQTTFDTQDLTSGMYQAVIKSGATIVRLPASIVR